MAHQTETGARGSSPRGSGPALAILATAPRPGLVLPGLCPPLDPAEAAALQTAWLKRVAQELPGVAVVLFGRPADAMPMLRYFAGPGVELREWRQPTDLLGHVDPMAAAAQELFAEGHGPVLVRGADAPDPTVADLLACAAAAARGEFVWAPDQRGAPWLCALPDADAAAALHACAARRDDLAAHRPVRRGPWARTVVNADDLTLLLHERRGAEAAEPPPLPVRDLQAALQFYEQVFGCALEGRDDTSAVVHLGPLRVRLQHAGQSFEPNGLHFAVGDAAAWHSVFSAARAVAGGDQLAVATDGRADFTATDQDGNRLTFRGGAPAR